MMRFAVTFSLNSKKNSRIPRTTSLALNRAEEILGGHWQA
jgi:hypothetical protein